MPLDSKLNSVKCCMSKILILKIQIFKSLNKWIKCFIPQVFVLLFLGKIGCVLSHWGHKVSQDCHWCPLNKNRWECVCVCVCVCVCLCLCVYVCVYVCAYDSPVEGCGLCPCLSAVSAVVWSACVCVLFSLSLRLSSVLSLSPLASEPVAKLPLHTNTHTHIRECVFSNDTHNIYHKYIPWHLYLYVKYVPAFVCSLLTVLSWAPVSLSFSAHTLSTSDTFCETTQTSIISFYIFKHNQLYSTTKPEKILDGNTEAQMNLHHLLLSLWAEWKQSCMILPGAMSNWCQHNSPCVKHSINRLLAMRIRQ